MKKQEILHNLFLHKVSPEIVIYLFKNQEETIVASRLSKILDYCVSAVYKNIKKLEDMKIIEYVIKTRNRTNKPFKLTQKGEEIAVYLMNIK